jgi:CheY-like chemotaxis protein
MRRVLLVDDNPQVRQSLCEVFKREADFDVCGEAENGREAHGIRKEVLRESSARTAIWSGSSVGGRPAPMAAADLEILLSAR